MPNANNTRATSSAGDDLGSTDEIKVFKDEGDDEDETVTSENLFEEKSSLIDLTESKEKCSNKPTQPEKGPIYSKTEPHASDYNTEHIFSPYSAVSGPGNGFPMPISNKIDLRCFFRTNGDNITTPPPAHCGIPPYQFDPKAISFTAAPIYRFSSSQYPYGMLSPDIQHVASWHASSVYSSSTGFRDTYLPSQSSNIACDFPFRFSSNILPSVHPSPYHAINNHTTNISEISKHKCNENNRLNHLESKSMSNNLGSEKRKNVSAERRKPHIKKPLNAFMLYMKEMRSKVVAECTLKESAAINQILGRRWHELSKDEQSKYYEKARQERQLHMELYPGWSARDNYGYVSKKRKRKREKTSGGPEKADVTKC